MEYAKMYSHGLTEIDKVLASQFNKALDQFDLLPEGKKKESERRFQICEDCPFNSTNAQWSEEYRDLYGYYDATSRADLHCSICGCPVENRVLSMDSSCGLIEWNLQNPTRTQPLKWDKYEE